MTSDPIILAFDTSAHHCTAAVVQGDVVLAHKHEDMKKGQAERLMGLISETLEDAGVKLENLDAVGVGTGPGNFTGIRIAVSTARGLALGLGRPAVGISGFDALHLGHEDPCACAINAHRDEIYLQTYKPGQEMSRPQLLLAGDIPSDAGVLIGAGGQSPKYPQAIAIARLTAGKYKSVSKKPSPFYFRPADAAPSKDAAPLILP